MICHALYALSLSASASFGVKGRFSTYEEKWHAAREAQMGGRADLAVRSYRG